MSRKHKPRVADRALPILRSHYPASMSVAELASDARTGTATMRLTLHKLADDGLIVHMGGRWKALPPPRPAPARWRKDLVVGSAARSVEMGPSTRRPPDVRISGPRGPSHPEDDET